MTELGLELLRRVNVILASANVLIAFSLLCYLFVYNFKNPVARSFVILLSLICIVFVGDVFLATARLPAAGRPTAFWLSFEWLGIALVVPAYLHFGDNLLATVGDRSRRRRLLVAASYGAGLAFVLAAYTTGQIVGPVVGAHGMVHFRSGPGFGLFAALYFAGTAWGFRNVWLARRRALTVHTRRRLGYLLVSVIAPLSVFPYLTAAGSAFANQPLLFRVVAAAASTAIASMLAFTAYGVAFQGSLTPDRAIKRDLIKYLIQVPVLGVFVIATMELMPRRLESSLGLPRDVVLALAVVVGIVVFQFLMRAAKPLVDGVIYGSEGAVNAAWLRRLDERLMTRHDLQQLLENIVAAMCDQLRVRYGCVVAARPDGLEIEAFAGSRSQALAVLERLDQAALVGLSRTSGFRQVNGYLVHPLRDTSGRTLVGVLAVADPGRELTETEVRLFARLVRHIEVALDDRRMQQKVLDALRALEPEIVSLQRLRGALQTGTSDALAAAEASPIDSPDFPHWVKDALSHYWGGPKLTGTPLVSLRVVREALAANEHNTARAMRAVLNDALERMKPGGERSLNAREWLLYNILELRFVRGLRIRDVAERLAMSESDVYRKQRLAIEALARQLATLEGEPPLNGRSADLDAGRATAAAKAADTPASTRAARHAVERPDTNRIGSDSS